MATSRIDVVHFIFLLNLIFGKYLLFSDNLLILSQTLFSFAHKITFSFFEIIFANAVPHAPAPITPILYLFYPSTALLPFMKTAFLSRGHLGRGLKFNLLNLFLSNLSIPASAIIAPLSVQYLIEGNKNSQSSIFQVV